LLSRANTWALDIVDKNDKSDFLSVLHADIKLLCSKIFEILKLVGGAYPLTPQLTDALEGIIIFWMN